MPEAPARPKDPHHAERHRLGKVLDRADAKIERLLDAYADGALELAEYKARREAVQGDVEQARRRLGELDQSTPAAPPRTAVITWAELWSTMSVEERRSAATALLEQVRIQRDKTVVLVPRWAGTPTTVAFKHRGQVPSLQPAPQSMS